MFKALIQLSCVGERCGGNREQARFHMDSGNARDGRSANRQILLGVAKLRPWLPPPPELSYTQTHATP
ncbi:hypothetical protein EMIT0P176_10318 [Pseudomonas sp. IT-P176]